jgi:uncharacterized protein (TIGR00255 family)
MTLISMTGFATVAGGDPDAPWQWEARSVNGRGLDLRCRLPDGFESLEPAIRDTAQRHLKRGSLSVSLKLSDPARPAGLADDGAVRAAIAALAEVERAAAALGLAIRPATAADILSEARAGRSAAGTRPAAEAAAAAALPDLFARLAAARAAEGAATTRIITRQLDEVASLVARARDSAEARQARAGDVLRERLAALMAGAPVDDQRLAQELALIAVKSDVSEEIDRLSAHVDAARALMAAAEPVGRRFDFLIQEFMREANTLCSKSASVELTRAGLDLKVVIDQMREQIQNVE